MRLSYHPRARQELRQAANWYEHEQLGLGARFHDAYKAALERIIENPDLYPCVFSDCRYAVLKTFPYGIVYRVEEDTIHIDSIRHHSRHPRFGFSRQ